MVSPLREIPDTTSAAGFSTFLSHPSALTFCRFASTLSVVCNDLSEDSIILSIGCLLLCMVIKSGNATFSANPFQLSSNGFFCTMPSISILSLSISSSLFNKANSLSASLVKASSDTSSFSSAIGVLRF